MKVKLLREARVRHYAGEIVEVSPDEARFLLAHGGAEEVEEAKAENTEEEKPKRGKK